MSTVLTGGGTTTLDGLSVTGAVSLSQTPAVSTAQSMVRLNGANGYGSTSTAIRRFLNTVTNQGSDITYADSATLGATFTINTSGVYAISYCDNFSAGTNYGITVNDANLTAAFTSSTASAVLMGGSTSNANFGYGLSWTGYLAAGAVIRANGAAAAAGTLTNGIQFTISRVA